MLRTLYFYLRFIPSTIYHSCLCGLRKPGPETEAYCERVGKKWSTHTLRWSGMDYEADLSALKPGGHYVFMVNHQSNFDIFLCYSLLGGHNIRFVAKQSLFEVPVFKWAMRAAQHIGIDRSNRRAAMKTMEAAVTKVQAGVSPIIFPEGTRNTELGQLMDFKIGGIVLALKCGLPVVPMVISGAGKFQPTKTMRIHPEHKIRIKALEPVDPAAYTLKDRERFKNDLYTMMNDAYQALLKEDG